ncbi:hypothetical protein [Clostridium botulinum]|uniref:hypothetical protein n=1 Tax=Clostridium botulinum TaxID=1491 RepID=UPI0009478366|nr:hypothetical protein [Clostridium botulinum]APQ77380.1 hypothetical protein RSJ10_2948 [Clostridium botulinum]MBN3354518.1 hypothetical protein [Clostridium botulinum]
MRNLIFNSLYIFEHHNKLGKKVEFKKGINIITSKQKNGNDKGKSILMKSLYHTLGADSIFDGMWKEEDKIYLVNISVGTKTYNVYRNHKLFKIYDKDFNKLYNTINRKELAEYLSKLYEFEVQLPNRKDEELELAPPVYSYLLNYIDQDYMAGSKFSSFEGLGQYPDFKENLIYNHFGIFKEEYFKILKKIEVLKKENKDYEDDKMVIDNMLERVHKYLNGMDTPVDLRTLEIELNRKKEEYSNIVKNLKKVKNNLVIIRNEKMDLVQNIKELETAKKGEEKKLKLINHKVCPLCSNEIDDFNLVIKKNSEIEDFYIMKDQLEELLLEVDRKIALKEEKYKELLDKLKIYEEKMKISDSNVTDVIKHKGYLETQENFIRELGAVSSKILENSNSISSYKNKIKEFNQLKNNANKLYEKYMLESKAEFNLKEITESKLKNIRYNIDSRGSNIPIATIIWYFNLLKVKYELNKETIRFPLVLDSPNNVELDDDKRLALFTYIFSNKDENVQLIVSTLGFDENDYKDIIIDKVVVLENGDYKLLNRKDYEENRHILDKIFEE